MLRDKLTQSKLSHAKSPSELLQKNVIIIFKPQIFVLILISHPDVFNANNFDKIAQKYKRMCIKKVC